MKGEMKDHERWEIRERISPAWMAEREEEEQEGNTGVFAVSQHLSLCKG